MPRALGVSGRARRDCGGNLVATLEVGACGALLLALNSAESTHLSLMARGKVVSSFKRQIRRIVLSRGIAFQQHTISSMYLIDSTLENNFR